MASSLGSVALLCLLLAASSVGIRRGVPAAEFERQQREVAAAAAHAQERALGGFAPAPGDDADEVEDARDDVDAGEGAEDEADADETDEDEIDGSEDDDDRVYHPDDERTEDTPIVPESATAAADEIPIIDRPKIPQPAKEVLRSTCSRARSREARAIIDEHVLAVARRHGITMDPKCKLHPDNDMLRAHEANKTMLSAAQWKCKTCGKTFRSEAYVDLHFDRRHMHTIPDGAHVCVGELCEALRCRSVAQAEAGVPCVRRVQQKRRMLCQLLMHNCFPPSLNEHYWHAHELFERAICDAHTCDGAVINPSADGGASKQVLRAVFGGLFVVLLFIAFCGVLCHQLESRTRPDLQRRANRKAQPSRRRAQGWLRLLPGLGAKRRTHMD